MSEILEGLLGLVLLAFSLAFSLAVLSIMAALAYGVAVLIFRSAFGIELPNPFELLPAEWQDTFGMTGPG